MYTLQQICAGVPVAVCAACPGENTEWAVCHGRGRVPLLHLALELHTGELVLSTSALESATGDLYGWIYIYIFTCQMTRFYPSLPVSWPVSALHCLSVDPFLPFIACQLTRFCPSLPVGWPISVLHCLSVDMILPFIACRLTWFCPSLPVIWPVSFFHCLSVDPFQPIIAYQLPLFLPFIACRLTCFCPSLPVDLPVSLCHYLSVDPFQTYTACQLTCFFPALHFYPSWDRHTGVLLPSATMQFELQGPA